MIKVALVLGVTLANISAGGADSLPDLMRTASACTDEFVAKRAAQSCDPPTIIAAMALRACYDKWRAVGTQAIKPPTAQSENATRDYKRTIDNYADGMAHEYSKIAELKVIDARLASNACSGE